MKEAMFYKKAGEKKVKCYLCPRGCQIGEGKTGFCRVRKNFKGKLFSLVYNRVESLQIDPIEKKPFFHFLPGSEVLSISTVGCNLRCKFCCNPHLSQTDEISGSEMEAKQIVEFALENGCDGIAYTYNEPTIFFEYAYEIAKMAKKRGLFNSFVTNGYTSTEAVEKISKVLDAAVIDIKGSLEKNFLNKYCMVKDGTPILETIKNYYKRKVHVEVTDLIIPMIGDDLKKVEALSRWIKDNINENIPLQFIGFFPSHKCMEIPYTDVKTLEKCRSIAKSVGLNFVYSYTSLDPGNPAGNTYCPKCGETLIKRAGCFLVENKLQKGRCINCKKRIEGVWERKK